MGARGFGTKDERNRIANKQSLEQPAFPFPGNRILIDIDIANAAITGAGRRY
jgi:hypothetical protein